MFEKLDFGRGIKRILLILIFIYLFILFIVAKVIDQDTKVKSDFFVTDLSCSETLALIKEREAKLKSGETRNEIDVSLETFKNFISNNIDNEIEFIDENPYGCQAKVEKSLASRYYDIFGIIFIFGVIPSAIIYLILSFIINGFYKRKE